MLFVIPVMCYRKLNYFFLVVFALYCNDIPWRPLANGPHVLKFHQNSKIECLCENQMITCSEFFVCFYNYHWLLLYRSLAQTCEQRTVKFWVISHVAACFCARLFKMHYFIATVVVSAVRYSVLNYCLRCTYDFGLIYC